jgi:hypothetical protein
VYKKTTWLMAAALTAAGMLPLATVAANAETFDFTLTGPAADLGGFTDPIPSGTITASLVNGNLVATSISFDGSTFATTNFEGADDRLFPNTTGHAVIDTTGISFEVAPNDDVNIFSFNAPNGEVVTGNGYGELGSDVAFGVGTFTLTAAVPEPSTWAMMLLGFCGLGFLAFRRKNNAMRSA